MNRKLHLSKTKHSKFNESGQLAAFYLFSFIWGCSILTAVRTCGPRVRGHRSLRQSVPARVIVVVLRRVSLFLQQEDFATNPTFLWEGYPHTHMV